MKKAKNTTTATMREITKTSDRKRVKKSTTSTNRKRLIIIKPLSGDFTKGYTFAIQGKKHMELIGEISLGSLLNSGKLGTYEKDGTFKYKPTKLEKASVRALDFPHVLASGVRVAREMNLEPCSAIARFGDGAAKTCKVYDDACERLATLRKTEADALAEVLKLVTKAGTSEGKKKFKRAQADHAEAAAMRKTYEEGDFKRIKDDYKAKARASLALVQILDLRR